MDSSKPFHTLVLDAGPMLRDDPPISSLLAKAQHLVTVAAIIREIRDSKARSRIATTWMPFMDIRSPTAQSIKIVTDFSRRTGDIAVLSRPDLEILALTYELEEQKNGSSNIRTVPGQKVQKKPPTSSQVEAPDQLRAADEEPICDAKEHVEASETPNGGAEEFKDRNHVEISNALSEAAESLQISEKSPAHPGIAEDGEKSVFPNEQLESEDSGSDSDSDGWITPSNIQRHQVNDQNAATSVSAEKPVDVACITSDFAMQNVLLSMNLNLLNSSLQRVRNIKTFILRCHACFEKTKDMKKQFCPRCGKPTLTRVSCSTNAKGEFKMHLKKNMQWNHRGDRYSIPKPVAGNASGKIGQAKGGGKGGWGQSLILAEDQKEYLRATGGPGRKKATDLMDDDYLPSILTGDRGRAGGRPKIGGGRNINSKKR